MDSAQSRVFVDGALIGLVEDPRNLISQIRTMRRQGVISTEVNCSYKEFNGDIIIHTDRGRARRPLIVLENGVLNPSGRSNKIEEQEIEFDDFIKKDILKRLMQKRKRT